MRVLRYLHGLFVLVLLASLCALGQSTDRHLTTDQAHDLYQHSAYAHGYIHGYESGFHNGDMDIHMGRGERSLKVVKDYRECNDGYQHQFGDRQYFKLGYKQGFSEGYSDSLHSRSFRAIEETGKIGLGFGEEGSVLKENEFDRAFVAGYQSGQTSGSSANGDSEFQHAASTCESRFSRRGPQPGAYCDAFMRGFTLGFGDGRTSTLDRNTQTAKK